MNQHKLKVNSQSAQTLINLASSLVTMLIALCINFFLSPYIVETLGAEANGFIQLANNFITYASLITVALNSMAGRFISIAYHQNKFDKAKKYYSSIIIGNIFIILLLIIPSILLILNLESVIQINNDILGVKILFAICFVNFFFAQIQSIFSIATYVTNKLYISNIITMLLSVLNAILVIIIFAIFVPQVYFSTLITMLMTIVNVLALVRVRKILLPEIKFSKKDYSFKYIKELLSSGMWNAVNQGGNILMTGLDLLVTNIFINPTQMGILSVAKIIPTQIISLGATVNVNFSPNLTISYAKNDTQDMLRQLRFAMKVSSLLMSISLMTFCVFGQAFYKLWMPSLDPTTLLVLSVLTSIAYIPASGTQALYNVFTTTNKLKFNAVSFLINGLVNVLIVLVLLQYTDLGIYAVAGVSSITTIIRILVLTLPYTAKLLNMKWYTFYKDIGISLLCASICFIISFIINTFVKPDNWVSLVVSIGITVSLSFLALFILLFNKKERNTFFNKFK